MRQRKKGWREKENNDHKVQRNKKKNGRALAKIINKQDDMVNQNDNYSSFLNVSK